MPKEEYNVGDQIEHKTFGKGTILEIEDVLSPGDNTKLTIEFKGKVRKMIIAKFVKLA